MSAVIPECERCRIDRVFIRIAPMGIESAFGVEWRCPRCETHILDICPLGPLAPAEQTCLNCGTPFPEPGDFAKCFGCGMTRLGALDFFGLEPAPANPVERAEKLFDFGLVRRALAVLNHALIQNSLLEPAWRINIAFLSGLGFSSAALAVIEAATEHIVNPDLLISYAHVLQNLHRHKEALDIYREYLATAPNGVFSSLALRQIASGLQQSQNETPATTEARP